MEKIAVIVDEYNTNMKILKEAGILLSAGK